MISNQYNRKNVFLSFVVFILFFPPLIISMTSTLSRIDIFIKFISSITAFFFFIHFGIIRRVVLKNNKYWIALLFFCVWLLISTYYNSGSSIVASKGADVLRILGLSFFVQYAYQKQWENDVLAAGAVYSWIVCVVNLVSQLILPQTGIVFSTTQWQKTFFLGNSNAFTFYYAFFSAIVVLHSLHKYGKINLLSFCFMLVLLYSGYISESALCYIIMIIILIFSLVLSSESSRTFLYRYYKRIVILLVVFLIWFIGFGGWNSGLIKAFVENRLNETISYNDRGIIWGNALLTSLKSPIFGYGLGTLEFAANTSGKLKSAHNTYLQLLAIGGFPALISFLYAIVTSLYVSYNRHNISQIYGLGVIITFLVVFIFEQNPMFPGFYFLLALVSNESDDGFHNKLD